MRRAEYAFATAALREGRMMRAFTTFIGTACLGLVLLGVVMQVHPLGPHGVVSRTVQGVVLASAVVAAGGWFATPWPRFGRAVTFVVWADVSVTIVAATMSAVEARLTAMLYLGLVGIFAAFILGWQVLLWHCGFGFLTIAAMTAWAVAYNGDTVFGLFVYYMPALTWVVFVPLGGMVLIDIGRRAIRRTARSAHFDPLTGLRNRRGLHAAVRLALKSADGPRAVVVAVCDIDGFKTLNDASGHAVGDTALTTMSQQLRAVAGPDDVCARIGGDELVLVSFLAVSADVADFLERLQPLTRIELEDDDLTVSVGAASETTTAAHFSIDDLIRHADAAMYEVKRSGGANCALYGSRTTESTTGATADRRRHP
jgi:diguanylate cyclase (GGDEF)-like protein